MKRLVFLIFSVAVLAPALAFAEDDTQLWTKFSLKLDPTQKVGVGYSQQLRFHDDYSEFRRWLHELSVDLKANKYLDVGATYRLIHRPGDDDFVCCDHRMTVDASTSVEVIDDLSFRTRLRWQLRFRPESERETAVRGKVGLKYKLFKTMRPYASTETSVGLNPIDPLQQRYTVGIDFRPVKQFRIAPFYRVDSTYEDDVETTKIFGLFFTYAP